ncbi:substrate-binding periplasmic protein [Colwellia sp. MEBiC06753]
MDFFKNISFKLSTLLLQYLLVSHVVYAQTELDVVVGLAKPPYVAENQKNGFELELVRNVLNMMNASPNYIFVPFGRSEKMLRTEGIDAILTANSNIIKDKKALTDVYIVYQNVAISLADRQLQINTIKDLSRYSLATFQSAHHILGGEFAQAALNSPNYIQVANQKIQLDMLVKKRVDVIIMDINIFNYYLSHYASDIDNSSVNIHTIFPQSDYHVAFKNHEYVPLFNQAFARYQKSEDYTKLKTQYGIINNLN